MTTMLAIGQVVAARFELVRPLGTGPGLGTWLARETANGRQVVLRRRTAVAPEGNRVLAAVGHPALLAPSETFDDGDATFDVYGYLPGGELGRLRGRPWALVVRRLLPVAEALTAVHAAGWVHGDLKSANVLLDEDGLAHLADFGSARRIGSRGELGGSPFSVSPERLDGAPAAVADDIYAFGVMLFELVTGHPPFYPDVTPERVHGELPAPLTGRPQPPDVLVDLVARCLAKRPEERPASMTEVRSALERGLEQEAAVDAQAAAFTPRPPAEALPIRPQWQRTPSAPTSADQLRREGFRKGLLAAAVVLALLAFGFSFFVLPGLVASNSPTPATTPATPAKSTTAAAPALPPEQNLEQLAELKRRAEELRAPLPDRIKQLEQRDVAQWGKEAHAQLTADLAAGDQAMTQREFAAAIQRFDVVAQALGTLEKRLPEVVRERLDAARTSFVAGKSAEATAAYASVIKVDPTNAAARTGLERSRVLDAVLKEMGDAQRAEQAGEAATAIAAYQRALKLDPATTAAHDGLARLQARVAGDAYAGAIAQAQTALARQDYLAAQAAYERAAHMRPGAPEVAEGLAAIQRATETRALASTLERATDAERAEHWSEALGLYREALKGDSTLRPAQDGVERTEPRAMLDAELQSFLDKPDRFFSAPGREIARNVIERASRVPSPGPRLQSQIASMQQRLKQAETPIRVALASDNVTDVQIYRIGKLGLFEHRDLDLMPGRYTVVGTRQGFRDVRKELDVLPGAPPPELVVRCEEPI